MKSLWDSAESRTEVKCYPPLSLQPPRQSFHHRRLSGWSSMICCWWIHAEGDSASSSCPSYAWMYSGRCSFIFARDVVKLSHLNYLAWIRLQSEISADLVPGSCLLVQPPCPGVLVWNTHYGTFPSLS